MDVKKENSKWDNFLKRITEPITIIVTIALINFVSILIIYLNNPVLYIINNFYDTQSSYFSNGYYEYFDLVLEEMIDEGFVINFPIHYSRVLIITIILGIIVCVSTLLAVFLTKEMKRITLASILIWPTTILSFMMILPCARLIQWGIVLAKASENDFLVLGSHLIYSLVIAVVLIFIALTISYYRTVIIKRKGQITGSNLI
ncbi:MAG: hypothetical protein FK734_16475 [Asgard group archaeon]|nr:hypothetical protein [Asgard group archaeon]